MSLSTFVEVVTITLLAVGAYAALFPVRRHFHEEKLKNQRIEDALLGTEDTKELKGTPSLFKQVDQIKTDLAEVKELTKQLKANGGRSFYDKVNAIGKEVTTISAKLDEHISETHGART